MSLHRQRLDRSSRATSPHGPPGQSFLVPQPAQLGAAGDPGLCGAPAWCPGSWRDPRASTSPLKVKTWLRTFPSLLILCHAVSEATDGSLSLSEAGVIQLAHGIFLPKSSLPASPSGRGT